MVSLEQVKQLETKVTKVIDYLKKATEEKAHLKEKLDSYQKRIDELEVLVQRFKEDQSRIEDGILSALDRLNQFEDALENRLSPETKLPGETGAGKDTFKKDISAGAGEQSRIPAEAAGVTSPPEPEGTSSGSGELDIF